MGTMSKSLREKRPLFALFEHSWGEREEEAMNICSNKTPACFKDVEAESTFSLGGQRSHSNV